MTHPGEMERKQTASKPTCHRGDPGTSQSTCRTQQGSGAREAEVRAGGGQRGAADLHGNIGPAPGLHGPSSQAPTGPVSTGDMSVLWRKTARKTPTRTPRRRGGDTTEERWGHHGGEAGTPVPPGECHHSCRTPSPCPAWFLDQQAAVHWFIAISQRGRRSA